jgi:hypothetical protein
MRLPRPQAVPLASSTAAKPRLQLVQSPSSEAPRRLSLPLLNLWHLTSLDAPCVAALWAFFAARCCGLLLSFASCAALFVAVWMLYAADRLLDARAADDRLEARHHFHAQHRHAFLFVFAFAALLLVLLLRMTDTSTLRLYLHLTAPLVVWLLLVHTRTHYAQRLPKEIVVGIVFAAAVFIPAVAARPALQLRLLAPAVLFAATCALNCLTIYAWEHDSDLRQAHATTILAVRHYFAVTCSVGTAALLLTLFFITHHDALWRLPAACALSVLALAALHRARHRVTAITLRAAADFALLTPLLFLFGRTA